MADHDTVLVFGAAGQDGHYLRLMCEARGLRMVGVSRSTGPESGDVADRDLVDRLVRDVQPSVVCQLAADSTTEHSAAWRHHATIGGGAWNVCEAVLRHAPDARVFVPGSALQFENHGAPIDQTAPFCARDPYAIARIQSVHVARYYRALGLRTYVGYFFHHDSPRRSARHLAMRIAMGAHAIARGEQHTLRIGSLDVQKEWGSAEDAVAGMWTLLQQDDVHEAVIGTGRALPVRRFVELCFGRFGLDWREHVEVDPHFVPEFQRLVSDPHTLRGQGWAPQDAIEDVAARMLDAVVERASLAIGAPEPAR